MYLVPRKMNITIIQRAEEDEDANNDEEGDQDIQVEDLENLKEKITETKSSQNTAEEPNREDNKLRRNLKERHSQRWNQQWQKTNKNNSNKSILSKEKDKMVAMELKYQYKVPDEQSDENIQSHQY